MIENHVTSFEVSKKLKEIGIIQESAFYWGAYENPIIGAFSEETVPSAYWHLYIHCGSFAKECDFQKSAFLASELLEMIPKNNFFIRPRSNTFIQLYYLDGPNNGKGGLLDISYIDKNLAECLGDFLIRLVTQEIIDIDQINSKLSK